MDERGPDYWRRQAADYRRRAESSRHAVVRLYFIKMAMRCDRMAERTSQGLPAEHDPADDDYNKESE